MLVFSNKPTDILIFISIGLWAMNKTYKYSPYISLKIRNLK